MVASLMFFGTCYDVYIHQPLEDTLAKMDEAGKKHSPKGVEIIF